MNSNNNSNTIQDTPNNSNVFSDIEDRMLKKAIVVREQIVDKYLAKGVSTDHVDNRVINELLTGIEANILGRADRELKADSNKSQGDMVQLVTEIFLKGNQIKRSLPKQQSRDIALELSDSDIVPGEDKEEYVELDLETFTKPKQG